MPKKIPPEHDVVVLDVKRGIVETTTFEEFTSRNRVDDCDCKQITCVCATVRAHREGCRFRFAVACAVPITCDHGYDVCPICDPCTCDAPSEAHS